MSTAGPPRTPLVEQVVSGESEELTILAAEGLLPLAPDQLIPLQVRLTSHANPMIAQRARTALRGLDARVAAAFLAHDAGEATLAYFAAEIDNPVVLEAILRRRDVPPYLLVELARRVSPDLQEVLLLRQDAIVEEPRILEALEENHQLTAFSLRRSAEIREHLVVAPRGAPAAPDAPEVELRAALEAARQLPASGEVDEVTGLSEGQVRTLPLPLRLRLSRGASHSMRSMLIKDPAPVVALSTIDNNAWTDGEIEQICRARNVVIDVLDAIATHREWTRKYPIVMALVSNPKTPAPVALRLLPQLGVRDLRNLSRDRNVSDAVRTQSQRLYRIKIG